MHKNKAKEGLHIFVQQQFGRDGTLFPHHRKALAGRCQQIYSRKKSSMLYFMELKQSF
jgi:hypothetical protein